MAALLAKLELDQLTPDTVESLAVTAYEIADAMLKERDTPLI